MQNAISVHNLGKSYTLAHQHHGHVTLAESLLHRLRHPFVKPETETFWALKDLSFDVQPGDVVGVIGRNGAGKSTLLKILSRITEPTEGDVQLRGRVGSLLEVGTGFHPELTGRENIYLNGNILGMRKKEIDRQFDAIVDFSGCERFLDTPVKRYSSGMYVRLAFAVAAHLQSEILVVDEVLAVGDAEFQKKCLGKMKDVATGGRTVLFVSHHMQSIMALCKSAIYMERGTCATPHSVEDAVRLYAASFDRVATGDSDPDKRPGSGEFRITEVLPSKSIYDAGEPQRISFSVAKRKPGGTGAYLNISIFDSLSVKVATFDSRCSGHVLSDRPESKFDLTIKSPWLKPGEYRVTARICNFGTVDIIEDACRLTISELQPYVANPNDPLACEGVVLGDYEFRMP